MNIQFNFNHLSDALKDDLKEYARTRFEHLETFLSTFQEDNKLLHIAIDHHEKQDRYEVKCTVQMGGRTVHHEETTHNPKEAIDKSEANLVRQIKKQIDLMRDHPHVEGEAPKSPEEEGLEEAQKFNQ